MTAAAISVLRTNPEGFFLMVEGGRIDHAHHSGTAYRALVETVEFSNAVRIAKEATNPQDTLIVVTADHSHVFTIGGDATRGNNILGKVVPNDRQGNPTTTYGRDTMGRPYTTLGYYNGPGAARSTYTEGVAIDAHKDDIGVRDGSKGRSDLTHVDTAHPDFLQEAAVPLAYESHAGEDVAAYALGPGAELFSGVREQSYVYHAMVDAYGWDRASLLEEWFGRSH
jgi:alkaline phosphatase